ALRGGWERGDSGRGPARTGVRAIEGVLGPGVLEDEPPDLLDRRRREGPVLEGGTHARPLVGIRAIEHRDEREGALALAQVGADRLAESVLIGDEVERVVGDLEGDANVEAVPRQGLELLPREPAQQPTDAAAGRDERRGLLGDD